MILSWITSSLTPKVLATIVNKTDSASAWSSLHECYASTSQNRIIQMRTELMNTSRGDLSIADYLDKVNILADNLALSGAPVSESDLVAIIMSKVGPQFETTVASAQARDTPITYTALESLLLSAEQRHTAFSLPSDVGTSAFAAVRGGRGTSRGRGGAFRGGRGGGYARGSGSSRPYNGDFSYSSSPAASSRGQPASSNGILGPPPASGGFSPAHAFSPSGRIQCQICQRYGHSAIDCYNRLNMSYEGRVPSSRLQAYAAAPQSRGVPPAPPASPAQPWLFDSGANSHITNDVGQLSNPREYYGNDQIRGVHGGSGLHISKIGDSFLHTKLASFRLRNTLYCPHASTNIISLNRFADDNDCFFTIHPRFYRVQDSRTGKILFQGPSNNGLYPSHSSHQPSGVFACVGERVSDALWHSRLGHVSFSILQHLVSANKLPIKGSISSKFCQFCPLGKSHKLPFSLSSSMASSPLELIHCDVWMSPSLSISGYKYYVIFVDDYSRYTWLYPLRLKSDVFSTFVTFNHIVETGLTLLAQSGLSTPFWTESFHTSNYIINRLPTCLLHNLSPFEKLFHKPPQYQFFKVFGCACFPYLRPYNTNKLQFRSKRCVFLGYSLNHLGYRCLDPSTGRVFLSRHVVFDEHSFPYKESIVPAPSSLSSSADPVLTIGPSPSPSPSTPTPFIPPPPSSIPSTLPSPSTQRPLQVYARRPPRPTHTSASPSSPQPAFPITPTPSSAPGPNLPPDAPAASVSSTPEVSNLSHSMVTRSKVGVRKPNPKYAFVTTISDDLVEPTCFSQAHKHTEWRKAMADEFTALQHNGTWTLVPFHHTMNVLPNKWVYKIKRRSDGSIERYKARLVANGFHQQAGLDYGETFSPVVNHATIRLILPIVIHYNWPLRQLDVQNAFLHGSLNEDVYMRQPPGFVDSQRPTHVCKLQRSLYGLKQAPRAWFHCFSQHLENLGFVSSHADSSLFTFFDGSVVLYLLIYVDDILITGNSTDHIARLIQQLGVLFSMKDLGPLHYFLGMEVHRTAAGLHLTQAKYITDLLKRTNMLDCKPISAPAIPGRRLSLSDGEPLSDLTEFRSVVGALQYLLFTRHDIAFAVNQVCQFMHRPTTVHWVAVKRILRYLKATPTHGIVYKPSPLHLMALFTNRVPFTSRPMLMRIMPAILTTVVLLVATVFFLVITLSPGAPRNNAVSLAPAPKLNTASLRTRLRPSLGIAPYFGSFIYRLLLPASGATTSVPFLSPLIPSINNECDMWRWTIIMFGKRSLAMNSLLAMSPLLTSWLIFLPKVSPLPAFHFCSPNFQFAASLSVCGGVINQSPTRTRMFIPIQIQILEQQPSSSLISSLFPILLVIELSVFYYMSTL
ncbi:hypothetical protein C1H46_009090 [Malus baccata]|uniref:Integrase catalytic domain-containing protein n=1 Tax=Malus baccata TaxID=106549 RepID=A0A540N2Q1_MALBA|nr:hypothetical protein C1H46_009090 [Malus baccata]